MSGLEISLAVVEGVKFAVSGAALLMRIKANVQLAADNNDFGVSLAANLAALREYFEEKELYDAKMLGQKREGWRREVPCAVATLKDCCNDLNILAGTRTGRKLFARLKRCTLAVANADTALADLRHIDLKLDGMRTRLVALETGDTVRSESQHVAGVVAHHANQVVEAIPSAIAHYFQDESGGGEFVALLRQIRASLHGIAPAPPGSSVSGATSSPPASPVHSPPATGRTFPHLAAGVEQAHEHGQISEAVYSAQAACPHPIDYDAARRAVEDLFPTAAEFLKRLEARRLEAGISEQEHADFMVVFRNLWAPWEIGNCLKAVTDKSTGLTKELGRGAFATVYEFRMRVSKDQQVKVAVKVMHPALCTREFYASFYREASLAFSMCHPCILKLWGARWPSLPGVTAGRMASDNGNSSEPDGDSSEDSDGPGAASSARGAAWLIMELTDGDIETLLRNDKLTHRQDVLQVYTDVAEGLTYMHSKGILHLDVKPGNILLCLSDERLHGRGKVADFGLSIRARELRTTRMTETGDENIAPPKAIGTLAFMAPELYGLQGDDSLADTSSNHDKRATSKILAPAVDVYAFGVTLIAIENQRGEKRRIHPPACFAEGKESIRTAWREGVLQEQREQWATNVFHDDVVLLEIARACTNKEAKDRPKMSHVLQAVTGHARGGPAHGDQGLQVGLAIARLHGIEASSADELFEIGARCHSDGSAKGLKKDEAMAVVLYQCAAKGGHMGAVFRLAVMHRDGRGGLVKDEAEALRLYRRAADGGQMSAVNSLAVMHEHGRGGLVKDEAEAVRLYRRAADGGNMPAVFNLALMYQHGRGGLAKDEAEEVRLLRQAADRGHMKAVFNLALMHEHGRAGLTKDESEAVRLYRQAADAGHMDAVFNLALMHKNGRGGLARDEAEEVRLLRRAADRGHMKAVFNLALMHEHGRAGLIKDESEAVRLYRQAADAGHMDAVFNLALMHKNGRGGLARDAAEEVRLLRQAADGGHMKAVFNLALMHECGRGVAKNEAEAVRLYRRAADGGHMDALFNLALMYKNGCGGLAKDEAEAMRLCRLAADGGHMEAVLTLAFMHEHGLGGLVKDEAQAVRLYRRAANGGHMGAANNLAVMHEYGRAGLAKDEAEAVRLYRQAADGGHMEAVFNLALMHEHGLGGLAKDGAEAVRLYRRAADGGHMEAVLTLAFMHEHGLGGLAKDDAEAVRLYRRAADGGHMRAVFILAVKHEHGRGRLAKDEVEAVRLYRRAADGGYMEAVFNLALMHEHGRGGLAVNESEAVRLYRWAADEGHMRAVFKLAVMHEHGRGGLPKDEAEAVRLYRQAADTSHGPPMDELGLLHEYGGGGLARDIKSARAMYRAASWQYFDPEIQRKARESLRRLERWWRRK